MKALLVKLTDVRLRWGAMFCLLAVVLFAVGWQVQIVLAVLVICAVIAYVTRVRRETAGRERAEKALRQSREQLEQRIQQRTAELERTNQSLQAEITERQYTEQQLRVQSTALEAAANAIVIADHNGTIQSVNPAFTALTGYSAQEAVGKNPRFLKSGQQEEAFYETLWETISSGQVWSGELTNRRKDGSLYVEEMTITPLRDAGGMITRYIAIKQDVTERKRAEEKLQESEGRLRAITDSANDAIVMMDTEGRISFWNPAAERILGYTSAEAIGQDLHDLIAPVRFHAAHRAAYPVFLQTGQGAAVGKTLDLEACRKDGLEISIRWSLSAVHMKDGWHAMGIIQDTTERKKAEMEIQHQAAFPRFNPNPVLELSAGGEISYFNHAAEAMARELERATPARLLPPNTAGLVRRCLAAGKPILRVETPIGPRVISWSFFPIQFTNTVHCYGGDITERKQRETQLFQSQKMETVGRLAGGIAHEFNSLMTVIIGQSDLLLADLPPANPGCKNAAEIRQAADRAASLTRQLLAYGGQQFLLPEVLDLNRVLADMDSALRQLAGGSVALRGIPAAGLKAVKADAGQIEQVIMNLAMNACDAMPKGGKLVLETSNVTIQEETPGRDPELKPGDYVMLAITDSGAGMSEEVKKHAFEPFFSTKDVGKGTGLGLATCHGIIKQSGGHISVQSEPGKGATFQIYLPQAKPPAQVPLQGPAPSDLPRGTETILLAEDDLAMREMAAALLRRLGYTVLVGANGIQSLGLGPQPHHGHVDLLFTDAVMPHMSGKDMAERVRALYPHTRVLFTSPFAENAIVDQSVLNQGLAHLQKPFTPSALAHKVRAMLDAE